MRIQNLQVGGWRPVRASQMAKNSPASPRVARRGTARPAEESFHRPPWRPNAEILPQSAGPDNPESRFGAYRGTRTITIPSCRRTFFTTEHTESGFAGHRRRLGKDVVSTLQPQPCHRGRAPSRPLASPHIHSSHRSGIGPARDVRTWEVATCYDRGRGRTHGYRRQIEDACRRGPNKLRPSRRHTPIRTMMTACGKMLPHPATHDSVLSHR